MSSAVTIAAVVKDGKVELVDTHFYRTRIAHQAKKWGEGCALHVRIEPEDEAWKYADIKHLYGHLFTPVSKRTGETVADVALRMKAAYYPDDGRCSFTQLNREELRAFTEAVEQDIREKTPEAWGDCLDAMALYERKAAARKAAELKQTA